MSVSKNALSKLIFSVATFGAVGVLRTWIPLSSGMVSGLRGAMGALFILVYSLCSRKNLFHHVEPKKKGILFFNGLLIGVDWMIFFEAMNYIPVSVATLCYYMEPTILILLSIPFLKEKLTWKKAICTAISLFGMVCVSGIFAGEALSSKALAGILLSLVAAMIYAVVVLVSKKMQGVDSKESTFYQLIGAATAMTPYVLITGNPVTGAMDWKGLLSLFIIGFFITGLSYVFYFDAVGKLKAQTVAIFSYVDPIVALFLSAIFLGERLDAVAIVGSVLIIGSAICNELEWKKKT